MDMHFVVPTFALSRYNSGVLSKPKTRLMMMMMDVRDGSIRFGALVGGSGTIGFRQVLAVRDWRPNWKGDVAG